MTHKHLDKAARPTEPHQPAEPREPIEPADATKPTTPTQSSRPLTPPETSWEKHDRLNAEKERQRDILNGRKITPLRTREEIDAFIENLLREEAAET